MPERNDPFPEWRFRSRSLHCQQLNCTDVDRAHRSQYVACFDACDAAFVGMTLVLARHGMRVVEMALVRGHGKDPLLSTGLFTKPGLVRLVYKAKGGEPA